MLTKTELERRKPVWTAFSEFWLDTELTEEDLQRIAAVAAASGYSIPKLREIYLYEVAPVVYLNCWSVAGVWAAFDDEWLHAEAKKHAERHSLWIRFWVFVGPGRYLMTYATERHWRWMVERLRTPLK